MDGLEMPFVFSSERVHRDQRIAKQVCAGPVAAVVVACGSAKGQIKDAALLIRRQVESPDVDAGPALPPVAQPRIVAWFARPGNRVELPQFLARAGVIGACVAGHSHWQFGNRGSQQYDVLKDGWNARIPNGKIHLALVAKTRVHFPGPRV